jgi:hypothetical protein
MATVGVTKQMGAIIIMSEELSTQPKPILAVISAAVLALCMFTPYFLVSLPIMASVGLSIGSAFRKEAPKWAPYVVGGISVAFLIFANSHRLVNSAADAEVKASSIYADAKWDYGSTKDEMRGTTERNASLYSPTDLELPSPYDGTNVASIYVNSTSGIMLTVGKGQFQCDRGASVTIKVDNGPLWNYPCETSSNGQGNYLFIQDQFSPEKGQPTDPKDVLTKGKVMTLEATFYDAGTRQLTFNIRGFDPSKVK